MANKLIVTAAPHITSADTTQKIMQRVCLALVPTRYNREAPLVFRRSLI